MISAKRASALRFGVCLLLLAAMALPVLATAPEAAPQPRAKSYFPSIYNVWEGCGKWVAPGFLLLLLGTPSNLLAQAVQGPAGDPPLALAPVAATWPGSTYDLMVAGPGNPALPCAEPTALACALEEIPVDVMGAGELVGVDPERGELTVDFGFRAGSISGPGKGFFTFINDLSVDTFTGTVRSVKVLEASPEGVPQRVEFSGVSDHHDGKSFCFTVAAAGQGAELRMSLTVTGDGVELDLPMATLSSGYLSLNGQLFNARLQ